jgi:hypothetical protein
MSLSNYSNLQASIGSWLARSDLTANIPDFITLFEAKVNRSLSIRQMEVRATTAVDITQASPEFISLPSDFISMRWVRLSSVTGRPRLQYLAPIAMDELRTSSDDVPDQPAYFTILSAEIELLPTPDQDYSIEMVYRQQLPALSNTNTSNWLLQIAPDAYLYGSLCEAAAFIQNDERVPMWEAKYKAALAELESVNESAAFAVPAAVWISGYTP